MTDNPAAVQQAVQRALSEALDTIQRQLGEVQSSFDQVKGALEAASNQHAADRFVALLPPLMHMQAAGAALAASIETVLRFVGVSVQWTGIPAYAEAPAAKPAAVPAEAAATAVAPAPAAEEVPAAAAEEVPAPAAEETAPTEQAPVAVEEAPAPAPVPAAPVDVDSLPDDLKQLHKKAKRFAKVTVQELSMYKKDEVVKGRENKDLYKRFKDEIDKSKALYDKRFQKIAGHNIDYLYNELVRVLAENDPSALAGYPHSTPSSGN